MCIALEFSRTDLRMKPILIKRQLLQVLEQKIKLGLTISSAQMIRQDHLKLISQGKLYQIKELWIDLGFEKTTTVSTDDLL